jgi:hypothetical protein
MAEDVEEFEGNDIWKTKYFAMKQLCEEHQLMNDHLAKRIEDINKLIHFAERDKNLLLKKYRRHGGSSDHLPSVRDVGISIESITRVPSIKVPLSQHSKGVGGVKPKVLKMSKKQKKLGEGSGKRGTGRSDKKERDPHLPKKPSNPFFWFCQEHRAMVQEQCAKDTTSGHHELTKALARMWNETSGEEKKV